MPRQAICRQPQNIGAIFTLLIALGVIRINEPSGHEAEADSEMHAPASALLAIESSYS